MKALIIGGAGFVGGYLIEELSANGFEVHATCRETENIAEKCTVHTLDITDISRIADIFEEVRPDVIYHLVAQSSVAVSWSKPQLTAEVNVIGSINVLETLRKCSNPSARLIMIGSGEEYGYIRPGACPLSETEQLRPGNVYAVTKACQEMMGEVYARAYGLNIVMVRAFNHSGAKQSSTFVISDFCKQISEIESGKKAPEICVGNLSAMRDFTDVRDIVRAYRLLADKGVNGKVYNIGRGKAVSIQYILDTALGFAETDIQVKTDPKRMRASDIPIIEPDVSEIYADTGWKAEISVEQTIRDTLDYWREEQRKCQI